MFKNLAYNWPLFPPILLSSSSSSAPSSWWLLLFFFFLIWTFTSFLLRDRAWRGVVWCGAAVPFDTLCTVREREPVSPNQFGKIPFPWLGLLLLDGYCDLNVANHVSDQTKRLNEWVNKWAHSLEWHISIYICVCVRVQSGAHISIDMPFFLFYGKTGTMSAIWCVMVMWYIGDAANTESMCSGGVGSNKKKKMRSFANRFQ